MSHKYEDCGYAEYIYIDAEKKGQKVAKTVRPRESLLIDLDENGDVLGVEIIKNR